MFCCDARVWSTDKHGRPLIQILGNDEQIGNQKNRVMIARVTGD